MRSPWGRASGVGGQDWGEGGMGGRGKEVEGRVDLSPLSPKVYREDYHTLNHFSLRAAAMILVCVARFERVGDKNDG